MLVEVPTWLPPHSRILLGNMLPGEGPHQLRQESEMELPMLVMLGELLQLMQGQVEGLLPLRSVGVGRAGIAPLEPGDLSPLCSHLGTPCPASASLPSPPSS